MTTRMLEPWEWAKLAGTELGPVTPLLDPKTTHVMVVEDGDQVVGCWAAIQYWHLEGLWIHPDYRKRDSVARRGLTFMRGFLQTVGARFAFTHAMSEPVRAVIAKVKGEPVPGEAYILRIGAR